MRTQPTIIPWRCVLALLTVMASLSLLAAGGAHAANTSDEATVTVAIPAYYGLTVDDINGPWSKGINTNGRPKPIENDEDTGNYPTFVGGAAGDKWPSASGGLDGTVPFCNGAVAFTPVHVESNVPCTVQVEIPDTDGIPNVEIKEMQLLGGGGSLRYTTVLVYPIKNFWTWTNIRTWEKPPGRDSSTELCVCVERKGLADKAGTYQATVTLCMYY